jgi:predicted  nucleic acid-binding Zn-ribbon protein
MKEIIKHALKKVTLELVYQAVNERTTEIISEIKEIKKRQEDDFRYLVQKMDTDMGQLRSEVKNDIGQLRSEVKGEISQLRTEIGAINQRIDTMIQMLMTIKQDQK